ncbi:MAG: hypothetical protein ACLFRG_15995 [Desulfococcaceae bacterium]
MMVRFLRLLIALILTVGMSGVWVCAAAPPQGEKMRCETKQDRQDGREPADADSCKVRPCAATAALGLLSPSPVRSRFDDPGLSAGWTAAGVHAAPCPDLPRLSPSRFHIRLLQAFRSPPIPHFILHCVFIC